MTEYYLWLLQLMRPANPASIKLLSRYGTAEEVYKAVVDKKETEFLTESEKRRISDATLEKSLKLIAYCEKHGIRIMTLQDKNYPARLKNSFNPPIVLFYTGSLDGLDNQVCLTGVGSRSVNSYYAKATRRICTDLAKLGTVLVSGMAVGVDHIVHQSAIEAGARTVGVLACGIEIEYPRGSAEARARIIENGGAIISELLPRDGVSRNYFAKRNRIMAGLADGVMVFQARLKSGSLITADYAVQFGRDLFCMPPCDVFSAEFAGVIQYLRDGAIPLFSYLDVVNSMREEFSRFARLPDENEESYHQHGAQPEPVLSRTERRRPKAKSKSLVKEENTKEAAIEEKAATTLDISALPLEKEHEKIINFLRENGGIQSLEAITEGSGISPEDILEYLTDLELWRVVEDQVGAKYKLLI